jgi:hypothetical protein
MKPFDLDRVNQFTLQKHHLTDSSQIGDILKIVTDIAGLHATGSTPPYLSLFARHPGFKKPMLEKEMYEKRTLVKIRCVRKTIYIHPKEMLPIYHNATIKALERYSKAYMLRQGVTEKEYASLAKKVLRLTSKGKFTAKELKLKLGANWNISPLLYLMCDQGLLVRSRPAGGWRDKNHRYVPFTTHFPDLNLGGVNEEAATLALVRHYLAAFGPVSMNDMFWWTDLGKTRVQRALEGLGDDVIELSIIGLEGAFHLLRSDFEILKEMPPADIPSINLLPYLDPYIMGYKDRKRYLNEDHLDMIFGRAGNATSVVLVDGVIVGVWDYEEKGESKIKLFLFREIPQDVLTTIEEKALALGEFIADEPVDLKVCEAMIPFSQRTVGSFMSPLKGC